MKVVLLCGGAGIRLKEDEERMPKALTPIDGKPILYHIMKHFSFYGFNDFVLCVDSKGSKIKEYLLNPNLSPKEREEISRWKVALVSTGDNNKTGARVFIAKDAIGNEEFILSYSDVLADINISQLIQFHKSKSLILTMTGVHPTTPLGIITHKEGVVSAYDVEARSRSTIKGGYFVCKPDIFNYLSDDPGCAFEDRPLAKLIAEKQVALYDHTGFWKHFDSYKDLNELKKLTKEDYPSWKIQ